MNLDDIHDLLDELESYTATDLENQTLDFKVWPNSGIKKALDLVVEMAVCMANGGGGTVVFGILDNIIGRNKAIIGIPLDVESNSLKRTVYEQTDPKLTPEFEDLFVSEGTGRLLVMHVHGGMRPYTDTSGQGKVRIGSSCMPLTGSQRQQILMEIGEEDYTACQISGRPESMLSPSAMEQLRAQSLFEKAPQDLLQKTDQELLQSIGVIRGGKLTRAGLLLAGKPEAIQEHLPHYAWTFLRLETDIDYSDRLDGQEALPMALARIFDRIMANNPIETLQYGLFHFEYRTYPDLALREALLNAFCHAEYRNPSPILIKHSKERLLFENPGGFIGGVSPENILHHTPVSRNHLLVQALTKLRLVNRLNLGVSRMFSEMLREGKEPPVIEEVGESVRVTFLAQPISAPFRAFLNEEATKGLVFSTDELLILRYLLRHPELSCEIAANLCQLSAISVREILSSLMDKGYLERGGSTKDTYWTLTPQLHQRIQGPGNFDRNERLDWEASKARILSILKRHHQRGTPGLHNRDIRQITHYSRLQVYRLMKELMNEDPHIILSGKTNNARYDYQPSNIVD